MHGNVPVRFGRGRLDSLGNKGLAAYLMRVSHQANGPPVRIPRAPEPRTSPRRNTHIDSLSPGPDHRNRSLHALLAGQDPAFRQWRWGSSWDPEPACIPHPDNRVSAVTGMRSREYPEGRVVRPPGLGADQPTGWNLGHEGPNDGRQRLPTGYH
jgi:hypothetical protein